MTRFVHEAIAAQAARTPQAPAVVAEGRCLSYAELDCDAARLAAWLRRCGVGPDDLIGVCMGRSPETIVALLGIMKAGAAYVPLDPAYPSERLRRLFRECKPAALITQPALQSQLEALRDAQHSGTRIMVLDDECLHIQNEAVGNADAMAPRLDERHLAYAMYTSGSTGQPKGVMVTHGALLNRLQWMQDAYALRSSDRVLLKTPLSFDVSVWEIFWPLMNGACQVVARPDGHLDAGYLSRLIQAQGCSVAHFVPSMLQQFLEEPSAVQCRSLRLIVCSGEELPVAPLERCRRLLPQARLHNLYGPTEATIDVTAFDCAQLAAGAARVPIGQAIANTQMYVLDRRLRRVPVGIVGELYIGGAGVARGYLDRPQLTAQCFLPDPFAPVAGSRLYKTGDLGRWRTDGHIEFLGRHDRQVKLRGFRIELGEIEVQLARHPQVKEAAVLMREDAPGDKRLVAYVVLGESARVEHAAIHAQLQAHLRANLPEYMVPSAFVMLAVMPLTRNGKLDRGALPVPDARALQQPEYQAPHTPVEQTLCAIWQELLHVDRIGRTDNFFELGGYSLLALQLTAKIRETFGVELELQTLFQAPTVAELAGAVTLAQANSSRRDFAVIAIDADLAHRHEPYPLTDIQQGYWIGRQEGFQLGNVGSYAYFELDLPTLDIPKLSAAWLRLVQRHDALRSVLVNEGQQRILPEHPGYEIVHHDLRNLPEIDVASRLEATRERLRRQKTLPGSWPPFSIEASLLAGGKVRLHAGIDELFCDAWSLGILHAELTVLYDDPEASLRPLRVSFRDYVLSEQRLRGTVVHERAQTFWRSLLADMPSAPSLPMRVAPEIILEPRIETTEADIGAVEFAALRTAAARWNLTPSVVLLTAYAEVLRRYSGQGRFALNITVLERPPTEAVRGLVGNFVSMLPLIAAPRASSSFVERARDMQQRLWTALDHRAVSGVQSMRERARGLGAPNAAILPVVFTSTLGLAASFSRRDADDGMDPKPLGDVSFSVMQTPQVWLNLAVREVGRGLRHSWIHVEGLFPQGLLASMMNGFQGRVLALAANPDGWDRVDAPTPLPDAPPATQSSDLRLEALFLRQVAIDAARVAVITPELSLSYGELELCSRRIAARLQPLVRGRSPIVAVVMERGWEQVAAVLGILRAGAAYMPVDPALPAERLQHLLAVSEAGVVLTQPVVAERMAWPASIERIIVDVQQAVEEFPFEALTDTAQELAYVIFTSGSTGTPKGVMIDHAAAVNTILAVNDLVQATAHDRLFNIAALSFDLSVYDIFGMLSVGAAIVMPRSSQHPEPAHWAQMMARYRVTLWNSVPAHMELLLESAERWQGAVCLRAAMLSGDWIGVALPGRIRAAFGVSTRVLAMGGATEAAIWSIYKWVGAVDPQWKSIPYGRALPGQQVYVLDEDLAPCPPWTSGEIYIAGAGVALGYWRDADQTAHRFVVHPVSGRRLYRTGDRGRLLPDGEIELLGRLDNQVKISGYRIDTGEIEHALAQCADVRQSIVIARRPQHERATLAAYVVLGPDSDLGPDDLRELLRRKIPVYAIPREIEILDRLPLSANGKVDRGALLGSKPTAASSYCAPRTSAEATLVAIYQQVLQQTRVSIHDSFFLIGGDSILAMQVLARIRQEFAVDLPLRLLFEFPEVAALAPRIMENMVQGVDGGTLQEVLEEVARSPEGESLASAQP